MTDLVQSVLSQYEKSATSSNKKKNMSNEDRLKQYFNTILPKGKELGEKTIRILPTKDGSSPFVEVYFHEIKVDGKWVKLYDPSQDGTIDGEISPLNDVRQALLETGLEKNKEQAKNYRPRKFYIVKVIDRDAEEDGVKFWRFKHNFKKEGILDKMIPIFSKKGDITDPVTGRDLILSLTLSTANNGNSYTSVNSILNDDPSPLHEDQDIVKQWIDDETTWKDVYSIKNLDYLEIVAEGGVPKWSEDKNQWVSSETMEEDLSGKVEQVENETKDTQPEPETADFTDNTDDLPF
jgi:hypothetical protein